MYRNQGLEYMLQKYIINNIRVGKIASVLWSPELYYAILVAIFKSLWAFGCSGIVQPEVELAKSVWLGKRNRVESTSNISSSSADLEVDIKPCR